MIVIADTPRRLASRPVDTHTGGGCAMFETRDQEVLDCHRCGAPLLGDPDDEPHGGAHGLPLCGECSRNRNEEADLAMMDMRDGDLDGIIDW
jgi:hypothetical protein